MSKLHGKNLSVYVASVKVGDATDCTLDVKQEIIPVTSKDDSNWEDSIVGTRGWSVSVDFLHDEDNSFDNKDAVDLIINASEVQVEFTLEVTGATYYYGNAYAEGASINAPMGPITGSLTLHGKDALNKAAYPTAT